MLLFIYSETTSKLFFPISLEENIIASKGELFFLDLVEDATFFVDEEAGASVAAVCTGVVIFNGETCEARKSLSTLLIS